MLHLVTAARGASQFYTSGVTTGRRENSEEAIALDDKLAKVVIIFYYLCCLSLSLSLSVLFLCCHLVYFVFFVFPMFTIFHSGKFYVVVIKGPFTNSVTVTVQFFDPSHVASSPTCSWVLCLIVCMLLLCLSRPLSSNVFCDDYLFIRVSMSFILLFTRPHSLYSVL